jgi:DNA cross-link repair 1C protein
MFSACIANPTVTSTGLGVTDIAKMEHEVALDSGGEDPQFKNLIGDDGTAIRCTGNKSMRGKLEMIRTWFESGSSERKAIDRVLGVNEGEDKVEKGVRQGRKGNRRFRDSDEETSDDDEDDEKGRTAHALFADVEGDGQKWWLSSPVSTDGLQKHAKGEELKSSPLNVHVAGNEKSCQREPSSSPMPTYAPVRVSSSPLTIPWDPSPSEVNAPKRGSTPLLDVNNFQDDRLASSQHRKRRRIEREETLDNTRSLAPGHFSRPVMGTSQRRESQDPLFSSNVTVLKPPPHSSEHPSPNLRRTRSTVENTLPPDTAADEEVQRRREFRIERLKMAERLSRARPDLVDPSYPRKRARLLSRHVKAEASEQYAAAVARHEEAQGDFSYGCGDEDGGIDWERSRELAKGVREGLERGVHVRSLLPTLQCLESQSQSREE